jgi:two-component system response regulator GlrR
MPTNSISESDGKGAILAGHSANVLILDFCPGVQLDSKLESDLRAMTNPCARIFRESYQGLGITEEIKKLSTKILSSMPDLLILLLSENAQVSAPGIFQALLNQAHCPPILVVPSSDEPSGINLLSQLGASDFIVPPFRSGEVILRIQKLLAYSYVQETPVAALKVSLGLKQFVGESPALLEQVRKVPQIARCDASVLVTGETGTGKEVCARAIHHLSRRADHPFVPLNCGAIPVELLENELFGHESGAFTSANAQYTGVIFEANGGTLFLDEIDSLPLAAQIKLLRFLQDKEYRPLGSRKTVKADVRVIAASNARMDTLLNSGRFRQDLFYRLNVLSLHLPPLRQRKEDIPLLARHFVAKYSRNTGTKARAFTPASLNKLSLYDWPGNVRELENIVERAVVFSKTDMIKSEEIDIPVVAQADSGLESFNCLKSKVIADFERGYLRTMLEQHGGNIGQAARAAQKNRRVFFQLMRKHQIRVGHSTGVGDGKPVVNFVITADKNVPPSLRL